MEETKYKLYNSKGVFLMEDTIYEFGFYPGTEFKKGEGEIKGAMIISNETMFEAELDKRILSLESDLKSEGLKPEDVVGLNQSLKTYLKMKHDLHSYPVYDSENNTVDAVTLEEAPGHIAYEAVKNTEGAVTHFIKKEIKAEEVKLYPVKDYTGNITTNISEADAAGNENLKPVTEDGKLVSYYKMPRFVFSVGASLGQIPVEGCDNQEEAWNKLAEMKLGDFINRDNTKIGFVE